MKPCGNQCRLSTLNPKLESHWNVMWLAISVMICYKFPLTSEFMCYIYNICSFMFRYSGPTYFIMCFMLPNMWYNSPIVCFFNYHPIHLTTTQLQVTVLLPTWPSDPSVWPLPGSYPTPCTSSATLPETLASADYPPYRQHSEP